MNISLSSYRSPKTEIKKSPIHRLGLFATKKISKDEIVVIRSGHIIDSNTLHKYKHIIQNSELQITEDFYLAPLLKNEFENIMTYVNHSCKPNLGLLGNVTFIAMRDVNKDEELALDYAMFSSRNDYEFSCNCKSVNCRKSITANDWKSKDLQEKYGNYFSSYLLDKIRKN